MMKCSKCELEYDPSDPFEVAEHAHEIVFTHGHTRVGWMDFLKHKILGKPLPVYPTPPFLAFFCRGHNWKEIHRIKKVVVDSNLQHIRFIYECGYVETHNKGPFHLLFADSYEEPASDGKLHYQVILREAKEEILTGEKT